MDPRMRLLRKTITTSHKYFNKKIITLRLITISIQPSIYLIKIRIFKINSTNAEYYNILYKKIYNEKYIHHIIKKKKIYMFYLI